MPVEIRKFSLSNSQCEALNRDLASVVPLSRDANNPVFAEMRGCALGVIAMHHLPKGALVELKQQYRTRMMTFDNNVPVVLIHNLPTQNPAIYEALANAASMDSDRVPSSTGIQDSIGITTQPYHQDEPDDHHSQECTAPIVMLGCVNGADEHISTDFTTNRFANNVEADTWDKKHQPIILKDGDVIVFPNQRLWHARHNRGNESVSNRLLKAYDVFGYKPIDDDWRARVKSVLPIQCRDYTL